MLRPAVAEGGVQWTLWVWGGGLGIRLDCEGRTTRERSGRGQALSWQFSSGDTTGDCEGMFSLDGTEGAGDLKEYPSHLPAGAAAEGVVRQ